MTNYSTHRNIKTSEHRLVDQGSFLVVSDIVGSDMAEYVKNLGI